MSNLLHGAVTNKNGVCNGTSAFSEIILSHADEIREESFKTQSKIANETDEILNSTFSMHHSMDCFETFKVTIAMWDEIVFWTFLKEHFCNISARGNDLV